MNKYVRFCPNVFVAACDERYEKGDIITVTTKYGKENECEVWNCLGTNREGLWLHSITRCDGFNAQERAKKRLERLQGAEMNANKKANEYWEKSKEGKDFLVMAEPIKVGHHSEKRHRALIERNANRMDNAVKHWDAAKEYAERQAYWEAKTEEINLSMPESVEYYEYKLEEAKMHHEGLKNGTIERSHSYSLPYSKKVVNEMTRNFELAKRLWL